jgi:hypothetical protein
MSRSRHKTARRLTAISPPRRLEPPLKHSFSCKIRQLSNLLRESTCARWNPERSRPQPRTKPLTLFHPYAYQALLRASMNMVKPIALMSAFVNLKGSPFAIDDSCALSVLLDCLASIESPLERHLHDIAEPSLAILLWRGFIAGMPRHAIVVCNN